MSQPVAPIRLMLAAVAALLGFAPVASAGQFDGVTVTVATFGGTYADVVRDNVGRAFAAEGGTLDYVLGQPSTNFAKLIAARGQEPPFDLLETVEELIPPLITRQQIEEIDLSKIPETANLDQKFYDKTKIGIYFTEEGIMYNKEEFARRGIPAPTRYTDLLDPRLKGRVTLPDIGSSGAFPAIVGMSLETGGSEQNIQPGLNLIKQIAPATFWSSSTVAQTALAGGDVWANCGQGGIVLRLRGKLDAGLAFPEVAGKHGLIKENYLVKVKGAKHPAAVDWVINAFLTQEMQLETLRKAGQIPTNKNALAILSKEPQYSFLRLTPETIADMYVMDYSKVNPAAYTKAWSATVR